MAVPATHRQIPLAVQYIQRPPMPTRRGEGDTRGQGDLDHRGLTLPAAQPHYSATLEPGEVVHGLDAHADTRVAPGSQLELCAVLMGTAGRVTSSTGHRIELVKQ